MMPRRFGGDLDADLPAAVADNAQARCRHCALRGAKICHSIHDTAPSGSHPPVVRRFAEGQRILEQGKGSGVVGVLRRGYARRSIIRMGGERILVGLAIPGDIIGGLPEWQQTHDFEAATEVQVCLHDKATVKRQMDSNPEFRRLLLQELDHQHHRLLGLLWRNGALTSRERIMAFLVRAVDFMPTEALPDGGLVVNMVISRSDWADLTNTAVETICRTLRDLDDKNLVTILSPYRFLIRDACLLATLAGVEPPARRPPAPGRGGASSTRGAGAGNGL